MAAKNPYGKNYIDHHLQLDILNQLSRSEVPVKFSDLKSHDIENSLFMYHLNKLINRGIVVKRGQEGFTLTPKGADWINTTGVTSLEAKPLPRPLVQLVILHKSKILLSVRKGQISEHLNKYLLPGGLHKYGLSADATADTLLKKFFPEQHEALKPTFISVAEMIVAKEADTNHVISHIFSVKSAEKVIPVDDPLFNYIWVDIASIIDSPTYQDENILRQLVKKLRGGNLQLRELFLG